MHKERGQKSILDTRDFRDLMQHCIENRHDYIMEISAWAQEYFQNSLCHPQIQVKALSCTEEATREHDPETQPSSKAST